MAKIESLKAREIMDSRGLPTVEADAVLADGSFGRAAVPSGASTGEHEALELRDGDKARFLGKGVLNAVGHVNNEILGLLKGKEASDQAAVDESMIKFDATPNKSRLGANAILAASLAVARASAASAKLPLYRYLRKTFGISEDRWLLPTPMFNVINGGKHADSGLDVQEFMLVPVGCASFSEALAAGAEMYQYLKLIVAKNGFSTAVGDEGGFAPRVKSHAAALDLVVEAIGRAKYDGKVKVSMDVAASEFHQDEDGKYVFEGARRTVDEMIGVYTGFVDRYPFLSIEDPLAEDDWAGWKKITGSLGGRIRIIGDDLFVTNPERLNRGIKEGVANSILIKLNQIGSLTETVRTVAQAQKAGYNCVISHRSGETEDAFIADLAVALNAGAIKTGAPCRSERLAKYNQLMRIEAELAGKGVYAGGSSFALSNASPCRT
ncbi:MAG: phosphopyruvate hydratase [Elusimicrobia bacterium]|nr:phosphopyruvate hydratase [Elusimicrobiota bacterium]